MAPWSYHLFNLLLHWLVVCLVFRIARDHFNLGDEAVPLAALVALVVATHPLATSAVDYVSARSAVMAALFYLLAFDAAVRNQGLRAAGWFALALLTKEHVVTLPLVVIAHQWASGRRPAWRLTGGLAALAAVTGVYRWFLLPSEVLTATHDASVTPWRYCMTEWSAYLYYFRLFAWPDALTVDRLDFPVVSSLREFQAWVKTRSPAVRRSLATARPYVAEALPEPEPVPTLVDEPPQRGGIRLFTDVRTDTIRVASTRNRIVANEQR